MTDKAHQTSAGDALACAERAPSRGAEIAAMLSPRHILRDARVASRSLLKSPVFSLSVIVILSLVIGVNTSIFTALYDSSLKPLPYEDAADITFIYNVTNHSFAGASRGQYLDYKENADLFDSFGLLNLHRATINQERVSGNQVTGDFFDVLKVRPVIGRLITMEDCVPGQDGVVVLPESVWRSEYNARLDVIGERIPMDLSSREIIGVAPDSVSRLTPGARHYVPFTLYPWASEPRYRHAYSRVSLLARLKPGVDPVAGLSQLSTIEQRFLEEKAPPELRAQQQEKGWRLEFGLPEFAFKETLIVLQAGGSVLLLAACLNLIGLLVSRAAQRSKDLSVRHALGAGRGALLRIMLVESALLVGVAAIFGGLLSIAGIHMFNDFIGNLPGEWAAIEPQMNVFAILAGTLILFALAMGAIPFAILWKSGMIDPKGGAGRTASRSKGARIVGSGLVVAQLAFSLALLVGAGLLARSYQKALAVDPGFDSSDLMMARIAFNEDYDSYDSIISTRSRFIEGIRQIPGVESVGFLSEFPIAQGSRSTTMKLIGPTLHEDNTLAHANFKGVSPEFFQTLGIPFREGRTFDEASDMRSNPEIIVDSVFADRYFEKGKAVGSQIQFEAGFGNSLARIIGVVERANLQGQRMRDGAPFIYYPFASLRGPGVTAVIRTPRPLGDMAKELRQTLQAIDPNLPLYSVETFETALSNLLRVPRMVMQLVALFAIVTLLVSIVGLYGIVSYDLAQRSRELSIRRSLGASPSQVMGLIMKEAAGRIGAALAIGLIAAYVFRGFITEHLFDITAADPVTYLGVSAAMVAIALFASYLPSRRAAASNPIAALRAE